MKIERKYIRKKTVSLIVPGEPVAWQRAGMNRQTGAIFTKQKTRNQEEFIRYLYLGKYGTECVFDPDEPVKLLVECYREIPKSTPKKNIEPMASGEVLPTKKPDVDNYEKLVMDALNKTAYHDDKQVVSVTVNKYYSLTPRTEIRLQTVIKEPEAVVTVEK